MVDALSGFPFCSLANGRPLGVLSQATFPFSLYTLSWHKLMCDHSSLCHNKQITPFSESLTPGPCTQVATGLIFLDVSLAFKTQCAQTEYQYQFLPQTGSSSHILFQFVSPSSSHMFYLETWRASFIPALPHLPFPINHLALWFHILNIQRMGLFYHLHCQSPVQTAIPSHLDTK